MGAQSVSLMKPNLSSSFSTSSCSAWSIAVDVMQVVARAVLISFFEVNILGLMLCDFDLSNARATVYEFYSCLS